MALNIKLKDTQGIAKTRLQQEAASKPNPVNDTLYYGGTVRGQKGTGASQMSNANTVLYDRGVQQIASPTQQGRTATPWRPAPTFVADRTVNRQANATRLQTPSITDQIKKNNAGIIGAEAPVAPTEQGDVATIPEANGLDDMYTGVFGKKKPTKGESIAAQIEEKRREQEDKLQAEKDNLSIIEQAEYLKKQKEQRQYMQEQENIRKEQERIAEEQIGIQEEQQFKEASDSISRLRQNLGFLGGSNSVSQQALDSAGRQIASANTLYAEMKHLSELSGRARGNQSEALKKQFDWDLKLMQDDLDSKVDKTIQQAFDGITAADMTGQLDTVEEVNAMRLKILNSLDADVAAITKGEIQRRQSLLDQYTALLKDEKERIERSNTVNADMSTMMGYYVDGNGEPFIDANGAMIPTPIDPPFPPQFLKETGQLLTFGYDEAGNVVANIQQLIDMPKEASDKTIKITNEDGVEETYQFNVNTGKYDIPIGNSQTLPDDGSPVVQAINQAVMNIKTGAQCGKFVNDVLQNAGYERLVGDSYESKVNAIQTIGEATSYDDIGVGSIFTYPVEGSTNGHIGIVTGVNGDGTYDIMDYNYNSDESQRYLKGISAGEILQAGGTISKPILASAPQTTNAPTPAEMAMFSKGAQYIGAKGGLSAKRYNEIANYQESNKDTTVTDSPYFQAFNTLTFDKPTLADQESVKLQEMIKRGDTTQAKLKLEALAKQGLGAEAGNKYDATRTLVKSLAKVQETLDALKEKGVDTSLLKGKYENLVNKFGTQSDPEMVRLGVTLKDQLDEIRRVRSGAALTEFEEKFYNSIFPSGEKNYDLNTSTLQGLRDSREMLFKSYLQTAYGDDLVDKIRGGNLGQDFEVTNTLEELWNSIDTGNQSTL